MKRIRNTDRPAPSSVRWLVKGLLREKGVGVLFGPPGSGKTSLMVDLACHVATNHPWRSHKVAGGPVVIAAGEDADGVLLMLHAWEQHHEAVTPTKVDVVERPIDLDPDPRTGKPSPDLDSLIMEIEAAAADHGQPVALVVIDTLASVWRDEANEGMADFLALCRSVADRTRAAVLVVHHSGKDASKGERGGSALRGGVDLSLEVDRGGDVNCITVAKVRGAPDGAKIGFTLEPVELGADADGDPITACVATPANPPIRTGQLTPSRKLVLRALAHAADFKPNGSGSVDEDTWRQTAYRMMPDTDTNKRRSFREASKWLISEGFVSFHDGRATLSPDMPIPPRLWRTHEDVAFAQH